MGLFKQYALYIGWVLALLQGGYLTLKSSMVDIYRYSAQATIIEEDLRELCPDSASQLIKKLRQRDVENMNRE